MAKPDLVYVTASPAGNLFAETGLSSTHDTIAVSGGGSGATTFLGLTDTPASYDGFSDQYVKVDRDGLVLEFGQLSTANLTDWSPFPNQILYYDTDLATVTSRPDRSLAMQLTETINLNSSTPTSIDATNGLSVKLLVSDGTGNPNLASLDQVGGKPGTRVILWYETEAAAGDTITITSDAQLAIITVSGTGARAINNINSIVLTGVSSWAMLESRILYWHLLDYSGATINMA